MTTLYHYCSTETFYSIISNNTIRLSSLSLSNDTNEGKLVSSIIFKFAKDDGLSFPYIQKLQESITGVESIFDGLGFCLSETGDLLSQWRGYANDGSGISIGFSKNYLEALSKELGNKEPGFTIKKPGFTLQKIEYDLNAQKEMLRPTYDKIKELIANGAFKYPRHRTILDIKTDDEIEIENNKNRKAFTKLSITVLTLFTKLFLLKSKAFSEEQEWRLVSSFVKTGDDSCSFKANTDRIIPYREYELLPLEEKSIVEVRLGPKNITPVYVIESFLKQSGFANVKISPSKATYR